MKSQAKRCATTPFTETNVIGVRKQKNAALIAVCFPKVRHNATAKLVAFGAQIILAVARKKDAHRVQILKTQRHAVQTQHAIGVETEFAQVLRSRVQAVLGLPTNPSAKHQHSVIGVALIVQTKGNVHTN